MKKIAYFFGFLVFALVFLLVSSGSLQSRTKRESSQIQYAALQEEEDLKVATFAGGCFWCTESDFEKTDGVVEAISGFAGGEELAPSYSDVSSGKTGHREAVQVYYDATRVSYEQLLSVYWKHIDPTDEGGQFADRGFQYTAAIFTHDAEQELLALQSKIDLEESGVFKAPIVTEILELTTFFPAEDYHQDYHKRNTVRYKYYRNGSGRNAFIEETWGDALHEAQEHAGGKDLSHLTEIQFEVTQLNGTELPFENEFWDSKEAGIYVDIVSGEALFSSLDKYDSGTGWPSFTATLAPENILEKKDYKLIFPRVEIRSVQADSHLGHLFKDGPKETGGLRYCINSAALRFVPTEELLEQGYEEYLYLFE